MGEREPGKFSGATAPDIAQAPSIGALQPGKRNLTQSKEVGDQWIDHGAHCDGKDDQAFGCFLTDSVRTRLIVDFKVRVTNAQTNYKFALVELKVDELMKKDDDLNWALSLVLDVAGAHFIGVAVKALTKVKASGLAKLAQAGLDAGTAGQYSDNSWASRAEKMLNAVTDKHIESWSKAGLGAGQKKAKDGVGDGINESEANEKRDAMSYIDQLQDGCDVGFLNFAAHATGSANDAELVVLWEGMYPTNHTVGLYKAALKEKIDRFKKSGVTNIGRRQVLDRTLEQVNVHRDTRVIWVTSYPSDGKQLWYQSQEGDFDPSVVGQGDPGSDRYFPEYSTTSHPFGPKKPREDAVLDRPVPEEFQEAALARSEQRWGKTETINPLADQWKKMGIAPPSKKAGSQSLAAGNTASKPLPRLDLGKAAPPAAPVAPRPIPQNSVFNQPPPPQQQPLPSNSVFAPRPDDGGKT